MIYEEKGLAECFDVFTKLGTQGKLDFEKGILQAIGYKEFHKLYDALENKNQTAEEIKDGEKAALLEECITNLGTVTVKYAKYQVKWLRKRI